jgi:molybdate transport system ATP-binding protein
MDPSPGPARVQLLSVQMQHRYPSGFALDVAFQAPRRVTALFGPSGAGKSTVLACVAGLLPPQQGVVRFGDALWLDTTSGTCLRTDRRRVGYVAQDPLLFPHLSVASNLRYGLRRRSARDEWDRVVEILQLAPLLAQYPRQISGGEAQRVALGRALLSDPQLLLLDEPVSSLDRALRNRVLAYLREVVQQWSIPALLVSHDREFVLGLCEWAIVLRQGSVVAAGAPSKVLPLPASDNAAALDYDAT